MKNNEVYQKKSPQFYCYYFVIATVAQLVEQFIRNERVRGSSPFSGSKILKWKNNISKKIPLRKSSHNSKWKDLQFFSKMKVEYSEILTYDALRYTF